MFKCSSSSTFSVLFFYFELQHIQIGEIRFVQSVLSLLLLLCSACRSCVCYYYHFIYCRTSFLWYLLAIAAIYYLSCICALHLITHCHNLFELKPNSVLLFYAPMSNTHTQTYCCFFKMKFKLYIISFVRTTKQQQQQLRRNNRNLSNVYNGLQVLLRSVERCSFQVK